MDRRLFLKFVTGFPLFGLARLARAEPAGTLLQTSPLAGFQFHEGARVWRRLSVGDPLVLVREPDNPYDPRAVRVEWRGHKLGYVPRRENVAVAQLLDRGARLTARISGLRDHPDPWERVRMDIHLQQKENA